VTGSSAVSVQDVSKRFKLYADRRTNLKEAVTQRRRKTRYEDFWAVRDVSLEIPAGSTYGLIGHNGSGKSTLLKLIAGIHRPTSGSITANGRLSALLELGAGFHPELSGRDNVYLNGAILGMSRKRVDAALEEIIDFSGLGQFIDVPVKVYSSGMYVRLGFSIAVTLDPEILVIDEIIAVGDEEFQRRCFDHLHHLRRRGSTIIFVTHSMALVQQLCDRVAWLEHGNLRAEGDAVDLVSAYMSEVNAAESARLSVEEPADAEADAARRGSGEVSVDRIEFRSLTGQRLTAVQTGDDVEVRVYYTAHEPVDDVVFGLGIHHESGLQVAGPNSRAVAGCRVEGSGYASFRIEALPLNAGVYTVSTAIVDRSLLHVYDYLDRAFDMRVQPGGGADAAGVFVLDGTWNVTSHKGAVL